MPTKLVPSKLRKTITAAVVKPKLDWTRKHTISKIPCPSRAECCAHIAAHKAAKAEAAKAEAAAALPK